MLYLLFTDINELRFSKDFSFFDEFFGAESGDGGRVPKNPGKIYKGVEVGLIFRRRSCFRRAFAAVKDSILNICVSASICRLNPLKWSPSL